MRVAVVRASSYHRFRHAKTFPVASPTRSHLIVCHNSESDRRHFFLCRTSSSSSSSSTTGYRFVPDPSWSIHDLRLSPADSADDGDKQTIELDLDTLALRSLIDLNALQPDHRRRLEEDVKGILRCVSVLLLDQQENNGNEALVSLSDEELYDAPRGLTPISLRYSDESDNDNEDERERQQARDESTSRFLQSLEHKFVSLDLDAEEKKEDGEHRVGKYFSVKTGDISGN